MLRAEPLSLASWFWDLLAWEVGTRVGIQNSTCFKSQNLWSADMMLQVENSTPRNCFTCRIAKVIVYRCFQGACMMSFVFNLGPILQDSSLHTCKYSENILKLKTLLVLSFLDIIPSLYKF